MYNFLNTYLMKHTFSTVSGDGIDSPRTFLNAASLREGGGPLKLGSGVPCPDVGWVFLALS